MGAPTVGAAFSEGVEKRRTYSPGFNVRVAMEAIRGRMTFLEIAAGPAVHPMQVSQWTKQALDTTPDQPAGTTHQGMNLACSAISRTNLPIRDAQGPR